MRTGFGRWMVLILPLAALSMGVTPPGAETEIGIGGGIGHFNCFNMDNPYSANFVDGGAAASHRFTSGWFVGGQVGLVDEYGVYPDYPYYWMLGFASIFTGYDGELAGGMVGAGATKVGRVVVPFPRVSVRIGPRDWFRLTAGLLDGLMPYSADGLMSFGVGLPGVPVLNPWLGVGFGPGEVLYLQARVRSQLGRNVCLVTSGRVFPYCYEGASWYSVSAALYWSLARNPAHHLIW